MIRHLLLIALAGCVLAEATSLAPRYRREEKGDDELDFLGRRAAQSIQRGERRFQGLFKTSKKALNNAGDAAFDVVDQGVDSTADVLEAGIEGTGKMAKSGLHVVKEGVRTVGKVGASTVRGGSNIAAETGELVADGLHGGTDVFTALEDAAANLTVDGIKLGRRGVGSAGRIVTKGIRGVSTLGHEVAETAGDVLQDGEIVSDNVLDTALNLTGGVLHSAEGAVKSAAHGLTSITAQTKFASEPNARPKSQSQPQKPQNDAGNQPQNTHSAHPGSGGSDRNFPGYRGAATGNGDTSVSYQDPRSRLSPTFDDFTTTESNDIDYDFGGD